MLNAVCLMFAAVSYPAAASAPVPAYTIETVAGNSAGGASSSALGQPEGVLLDFQGDIYFSDAMQNTVRKIDTSGKITVIAGTGAAGFSGDSGPATSAQLNQPYGLAADGSGNLYIADLGNARVRVVAPNGNIATFAGGGSVPAGSATLGATPTAVSFQAPRNIAVDSSGAVYISDFNAHQIYRVANGVLTVFAGTGTAGNAGDSGPALAASLAYPAGLAAGFEDELYVADSGNDRIRKIVDGIITTVASVKRPTGVAVDLNETLYVAGLNTVGPVGSASLVPGSGASDIAVDLVGNAAFVTGTAVERANLAGKVTTVLGGNASQPAASSTSSELQMPVGIALDGSGNIYIADQKANAVLKLNSAGAITTVVGAGGSTTLNAPSSVAIDPSGNLYIADTGNNRVIEVGTDGTTQTLAAQLSSPAYVFADANGLLIADTGNNRIVAVDSTGAVSTAATAEGPTSVIRDANGDIYVSEGSAGQVVVFQANGWTSPLLEDAKAPAGLALDASGNLIVADSGHNTVRLVAPGGSFTTIAGTGTAGDSGDKGPATSAMLNAPMDVKVASSGQIYVADSLNGAIRVLVPTAQAVVPPPGESAAPFTVSSSASLLSGPVAAGEIVSISGSGFDPANTQVTFDGNSAFVYYTSPTEVNAVVPATVAGETSTSVAVVSDGQTQGPVSVAVAGAAPGLFTTSGSGTGPAVALNQDSSLNSASNPAAAGSVIVLYSTGAGAGTVTVSIGGNAADVLYAGAAPGYSGLMQMNVRVPAGVASGAVPVVLTSGSAASQSGVTIQVQ